MDKLGKVISISDKKSTPSDGLLDRGSEKELDKEVANANDATKEESKDEPKEEIKKQEPILYLRKHFGYMEK